MPLLEVHVSMRNQIYFTPKSYYTGTRNKFAGNKTDRLKDYDIQYDSKQKHGVGVTVACHSMISDLTKI